VGVPQRVWRGATRRYAESGGGLDVALVLDATASMGTHLRALRRGLDAVLEAAPSASVRWGVVAYKDHDDPDYATRTLPFTANPRRVRGFLDDAALALGRGGSGGEALECALRRLNRLRWRPGAAKMALLVGDRPPASVLGPGATCARGVDYRDEVELLAAGGVRVHAAPVGSCLTASRVLEYVAARTGGQLLPRAHVRELAATLGGAVRAEAQRAALSSTER